MPDAPATRFAVENLQDCRLVSILVESKRKGAKGPCKFVKDRPADFGPAAAVIVPLTPLHREVATLDGRKMRTFLTFGQDQWQSTGRILPKNVSDMRAEFVAVEPT